MQKLETWRVAISFPYQTPMLITALSCMAKPSEYRTRPPLRFGAFYGRQAAKMVTLNVARGCY